MVFSQFLRCAAAKRVDEANKDSAESKAFEGALLYVYGGDELAVETALKVIEGSEDTVPGIDESENLGVKCTFLRHGLYCCLRQPANICLQSRKSSKPRPAMLPSNPKSPGSTQSLKPTPPPPMPFLPVPTPLSTTPA